MTKYRPARDIPEAVRQLKSTRPVDIVEWIISRYNEVKTQESITMWFKRHPTIKEDLVAEIRAEQLPEKEIKEIVFKSGTFETYVSVVNWIKEMRRRRLTKIKDNISALKRVCMGVKPKKNIDLRFQGWVMKHPDRLTLEDAEEFIDLMMEHYPDVDISTERNVMRNFLMSKGIFVGMKISGAKHVSVGKYAKMYVHREILQKMFDWLKTERYEAYVLAFFMFKTATRIEATINARLENISVEGDYVEIRVFDKARRSIYPEGKPWDKHISSDLYEEIKLLTGYPEKVAGKIFTLDKKEMSYYSRTVIKMFYPELWEVYPAFIHVNHFWRHMFAQHMLRKTEWKYGIVAALGGWEVKSLEESYGKPPRAIVKEWGLKQIPEL